MPYKIVIDGIIGGWEIDGRYIRNELEKAGGQPVYVEIASPGGFVFDGIEIYNLFKNYSGFVHMHIIGLAASMASYIPLAGNKITAEENAVFMIHNVWGGVIGDYREFEKQGQILQGLTNLLAKAYAAKTGKPLSEIINLMDAETFFFGQEIIDNGFIDEIIPVGKKAESKSDSLLLAKMQVEDCFSKMKKFENKKREDIQKAAAMLNLNVPMATINGFDNSVKLVDEPWSKSESEQRWRDHSGVSTNDDLPNAKYRKRFVYYDSENQKSLSEGYKLPIMDYKNGEFVNIAAVRNALSRLPQTQGIPQDEKDKAEKVLKKYLDKFNDENALINFNNKPAESGKKEGSKIMNLDQLKKEHPDLYNKILQAGIDSEKERWKAHLVWFDAAPKEVIEAIKSGEQFTNVHLSIYSKASTAKKEVQASIAENPGNIQTETELDDEEQKAKDLLSATLAHSKKGGNK